MLAAMSLRLAAALTLALAALPASAQVYKWVDEKGQVNYSNAPPPVVADKAEPVEEKISVMGMDPAVRAAAERRFAEQARAEEADWQQRQQAMAAQARAAPPAPRPLTESYASPYAAAWFPVAYGSSLVNRGQGRFHHRPFEPTRKSTPTRFRSEASNRLRNQRHPDRERFR
jgi:hypothetical protein